MKKDRQPPHDYHVGEKFGRLTIIELLEKDKWRNPRFRDVLCKCDCGRIKQVRSANLLTGNSLSCGCLAIELAHEKAVQSLIGRKFGRLTPIAEAENSRYGNLKMKCLCDCGKYKNVSANDLRMGMTRSCGCYKIEEAKKRLTEDLTNKTFYELTAIKQVEDHIGKTGNHRVQWLWRCSCGREIVAMPMNVKRGMQKTCGHLGKSEAEHNIILLLTKLHIPFVYDCEADGLTNPETNYPLLFDFAITRYDGKVFVIEHQGKQHFVKPNTEKDWFGKQQRELTDKLKKDYCKKNNIVLYETRYDEDYISHVKQILLENKFVLSNIA